MLCVYVYDAASNEAYYTTTYTISAVRKSQVPVATMRMRNLSKPNFGHVMKPNLTLAV